MNQLEQEIRAAGTPLRFGEAGFFKAFTFAADFVGFNGHFPDSPILPGVVQLMAGGVTAMDATGKTLRLVGVSRTKFIRQVVPGETLVVTGTLKEKDGILVAAMTLTCENETASTFTLTLTEETE